jgi:hypothetical protein
MQDVICSPEIYYAQLFQDFLHTERNSIASKWIFDIIDNTFAPKREQIFMQTEKWCLCADQHHGHDTRYLVIFKDVQLWTIRDLRDHHVELLVDVRDRVTDWLRTKHKKNFHMFFHYMPSVFQLHLHVTSKAQYINMNRAHFLSWVIKNLKKNSHHYTQALLLTSSCRTIKRAETHDTVQYPI